MKSIRILAIMLTVFAVTTGFSLENTTVPQAEILSGGPPKDGIPAILHPKMVPAHRAGFLKDDDVVIALEVDGQFRAYPIRILTWHEVVNDATERTPFVVSF